MLSPEWGIQLEMQVGGLDSRFHGNDNLLPLAGQCTHKIVCTYRKYTGRIALAAKIRPGGEAKAETNVAYPTNSVPLGELCDLAVNIQKMRGQIGQIGQTGQIGQATIGRSGKQRNWIPAFAGMTTFIMRGQIGQSGQTGQNGQEIMRKSLDPRFRGNDNRLPLRGEGRQDCLPYQFFSWRTWRLGGWHSKNGGRKESRALCHNQNQGYTCHS